MHIEMRRLKETYEAVEVARYQSDNGDEVMREVRNRLLIVLWRRHQVPFSRMKVVW